MKFENQVVRFELSKRLEELGFKQNSVFCWVGNYLVFKTQTGLFDQRGAGLSLHPYSNDAPSAYTVAELGEMLPENIEDDEDGNIFELLIFKENKKWYTAYYFAKTNETIYAEEADTEADARAKMIIYLKENNLI